MISEDQLFQMILQQSTQDKSEMFLLSFTVRMKDLHQIVHIIMKRAMLNHLLKKLFQQYCHQSLLISLINFQVPLMKISCILYCKKRNHKLDQCSGKSSRLKNQARSSSTGKILHSFFFLAQCTQSFTHISKLGFISATSIFSRNMTLFQFSLIVNPQPWSNQTLCKAWCQDCERGWRSHGGLTEFPPGLLVRHQTFRRRKFQNTHIISPPLHLLPILTTYLLLYRSLTIVVLTSSPSSATFHFFNIP